VARAERVSVLLGLLLLTGGCALGPSPPPVPALRAQAQEAQESGVRRYVQGDHAAAARHFATAVRLYLSLDDRPAADRNRLQLSQTLLALGQPQEAWVQTLAVQEPAHRLAALLLQVQAQLALQQTQAAQATLQRAWAQCEGSCPERGRLLLLQARLAWATGDGPTTAEQAQAATAELQARGQTRELANAWRLLAAAWLRQGRSPAALQAAQAALDLDRALGLPRKVAQDWLLIGDIQRASDPQQAHAAFERAAQIAQAAGLNDLARQANQRIQETPP